MLYLRRSHSMHFLKSACDSWSCPWQRLPRHLLPGSMQFITPCLFHCCTTSREMAEKISGLCQISPVNAQCNIDHSASVIRVTFCPSRPIQQSGLISKTVSELCFYARFELFGVFRPNMVICVPGFSWKFKLCMVQNFVYNHGKM